ncbi:MAG TPA: LCP family protein, partial [Roseiflexaceae bacterium]|nr:LCP family protein [Roseiflexaceae bacterium]
MPSPQRNDQRGRRPGQDPESELDQDGAYTGETRVMPRVRPPDIAPPPAQARRVVRRRKRSIGRTIRLAVLGIAGLVLIVLVLVYLQVRNLAGHISVADVRPAPVIATPLAGANILLIGVDQRPDFPEEGVRSDTLIVLHLDTPGRWVSMLSIPRDSVVEVGDLGQVKINTAYSYGFANAQTLYGEGASATQGGMALAAQTVEQFTGVPIHYVAQVNFDGFASIVDALGGVTIDVPRRIVDDQYPTPDFGTMRVEFEPGPQHMDGQRALIYARTRHADSDFG